MVQIVDTSVAIKWFVVESGRDRALEVLQNIFENPGRFAVPELFFFELAHVFNRIIPRPTDHQIQLLNQVCLLGFQRFSMSKELLDSIRTFQRRGLSGYDGAYVALAKLLGGKWITFDAKAHKQIQDLALSELLT